MVTAGWGFGLTDRSTAYLEGAIHLGPCVRLRACCILHRQLACTCARDRWCRTTDPSDHDQTRAQSAMHGR